MEQLEEEMKTEEEQSSEREKQKDEEINELTEIKMIATNPNFETLEEPLESTSQELDQEKEKIIEASNLNEIKMEVEDKEIIIDPSNDTSSGNTETHTNTHTHPNNSLPLGHSYIRIVELEAELHRRKELEAEMIAAFSMQTQQLEESKISLEESKLEIVSLLEKLEKLMQTQTIDHNHDEPQTQSPSNDDSAMKEEEVMNLKSELQLIKNKLKSATEADENSRKAMDDLALALKEVAAEANYIKEKLNTSEEDLKCVKQEAEQLTTTLRSTEEKYEEARKEAELYKSNADRLKSEAEESFLAWNGKETVFVDCIKRVEDERYVAQQENRRLRELLRASDHRNDASTWDENQNLRDILKQALNEANVAKEAAGIASAENSQLKDTLTEKEQALIFLSRENENLKINEAAAFENIKELKKLLSETSNNKPNEEGKRISRRTTPLSKDQEQKSKTENSTSNDQKGGHEAGKKKFSQGFNFSLRQLNIFDRQSAVVNEEVEIDEALKGSIFDVENGERVVTVGSEDFENVDGNGLYETENDGNTRRKKALLRRFGDLLIKRRNS